MKRPCLVRFLGVFILNHRHHLLVEVITQRLLFSLAHLVREERLVWLQLGRQLVLAEECGESPLLREKSRPSSSDPKVG